MAFSFFDEIVRATPEEVEDIIVEPDGEWHSEDNAYGSAGWKAARAAAGLSLGPPVKEKERSPTPVKPSIAELEKKKSLPSNAEIVILDSDDEDEGRVKRELSPSYDQGPAMPGVPRVNGSHTSMSSGPPRSQTVDSDVIDLTLDSEDEAPQPVHGKKRRPDESEPLSPTENIWKKSRVDDGVPQPVARSTGLPSDPASFNVPRQSHPPAPSSPNTPRYEPPISYAPQYPVQHPLPPRPGGPPPGTSGTYGSFRVNGAGPSNAWRQR